MLQYSNLSAHIVFTETQTQKEKRMASLQCEDYKTALDIAIGFYEFDETIDPKDKVYFQKRGYNSWMVLLPIEFR